MKLRAPAKVNLSLRILGRRPDGFHDIESLITPLSLADEVTVDVSPGDRITVTTSDPTIPDNDTNLGAQAARTFFAHTGLTRETHVHIEKRIPAGAGLGGGSSDAAAVITALDHLLDTNLAADTLTQLATSVGSDVPFFLQNSTAWARGRGEQLSPTTLPGPLDVVLIKPPFGVPTPWAYQHWRDSRDIPNAPTAPQLARGLHFQNDLERPVFQKFLLLPIIKSWLIEQPGVEAALMSGSGATVFGVCASADHAASIAAQSREHFGETFWVTSCRAGADPTPLPTEEL